MRKSDNARKSGLGLRSERQKKKEKHEAAEERRKMKWVEKILAF